MNTKVRPEIHYFRHEFLFGLESREKKFTVAVTKIHSDWFKSHHVTIPAAAHLTAVHPPSGLTPTVVPCTG
jgi:hypothetical protein